MMFSRTIASAVLSATLASAALTPLSSAANARDWDGRGSGSGMHDRDFREHRGDRGGRGEWRHDGWRGHRDHGGRNLAIGAFAAVLGLAIAAEASRDDRYRERY